MRTTVTVLLALALTLVGSAQATAQSTPSINALSAGTPGLSQSVAPLSGGPFVLTVNGQGFVAGAEVLISGSPLTTTVVNPNQLTATVPTSALSTAGSLQVSVRQKDPPSAMDYLYSNVVLLRVIERGDANGSRTVNIADALTVARNIAGLGGEPPFPTSVGDLDFNGTVNSDDAKTIALFSAGLLFNLPTPSVTMVSPTPAVRNTLLTITGTGFSTNVSNMQVAFPVTAGIQRVTPTTSNLTTLTVTVPNSAVSGAMEVFRLDAPSGAQPFPLLVQGTTTPVIVTAVNPLSQANGGAITLTGMGFSVVPFPSVNTIYFRSAQGVVGAVPSNANATPNSLTVTIPDAALCGDLYVSAPAGISNRKPVLIPGSTCPLLFSGIRGDSAPGQIVVLDGTGFSGPSPQNNIVRFATNVGTVIAPVLQSGATELHVRVPASALPGPVTIEVGGMISNAINTGTPPTLTTIDPLYGVRVSYSVPLTLTGTNFQPGATNVLVSGNGVTVGNVNVNGTTSLTATFSVYPSAESGVRTVTVTTPAGTSNTINFTIYGEPTLTSIQPFALGTNANTPIAITGTDFLQGSTTLNTGGGVTTQSVNVVSPTSITATFNTTNVLGSRTVSVTTPAGISNELTYKAYGQPDNGGVITPGLGAAGETVGVDILVAGAGNLVPGQTTFFTNQGGITVTNVDVYSSNNARATFVIAPDAIPGGRTFQWQTPFGVTTNTAGLLDFVVNPPLAKLTTISPTFGLVPSNPTVTLTGSGFVNGATTVSAGNLAVSNIQVQSPTSLTAVFAIPAGTSIGSRNVTVTTTTTSNAIGFAVPGAPTFASILPVSAYRGESVVVTLTGTNFVPGVTSVTFNDNTGVTVSEINVVNSTSMTARFTISPNAPATARNVQIAEPGSSPSTARTFTVQTSPPPPTLTNINPTTGTQGSFVTMTLTGTNFFGGGTTVGVDGTGVSVSGLSVTSSTSMTATLLLSGAPGARNVSVTTPSGTTTPPLTFTIQPSPTSTAVHVNRTVVAGIAGGPGSADGGGALARFDLGGSGYPSLVWGDGTYLYIPDSYSHTIRRMLLSSPNEVTTIAGFPGLTGGADGIGSAARFNNPTGVWGDGSNLYVTDSGNHTIRKIVLATGAVSTLAGAAGQYGYADLQGSAARFFVPTGIWGNAGILYVSDRQNNAIRQVIISTGATSTVLSTGLNLPYGISGGTVINPAPQPPTVYLYVLDEGNNALKEIVNGVVNTVAAGFGTADSPAAKFYNPRGIVCCDQATTSSPLTAAYVTDTRNQTIRQVFLTGAARGTATTLAGSAPQTGTSDGTGVQARFNLPAGIWKSGSNLYAADSLNRTIRKIVAGSTAATTTVTTLAGLPKFTGSADGTGAAARFRNNVGIWSNGTYAFTTEYFDHTIRQVRLSDGLTTTLAGLAGNNVVADGTGSAAHFKNPAAIWGNATNLFVLDNVASGAQSTIRKIVIATGAVTTLATGLTVEDAETGIWGDGLYLYVAETSNSTIRKIDMTTGAITTLAGTAGVSGWNDATGTAALFNRPAGIWGDGINLYVCDEENYVIRKIVLATGAVTTIAGMPNTSGLTDGIGSAARFDDPRAIWGDGTQLYVSQLEATGIRRIALSNFAVTTIPGTAVPGFEDYVTGISGNGAQLFAVDVENTVRTLTPDAAQLPSTSSMSPSTGAAGTTFPVIIKGAGFVPGTTVSAINGNGLSVSSAIATGPGTVIANFTIAPGSVTGPRTVTVATPAGSTNIIFNVQ